MNKQIMKLSTIAIVMLLTTACSKNEMTDHNTETQSIAFTMSEAPYNDDIDIFSRAEPPVLLKDTLSWGDLEAEVELERDRQPLPNTETRAITSGNSYTILVFKARTRNIVAQARGRFDAKGVFRYELDSKQIQLSEGVYDFFCYTHQYARLSDDAVYFFLEDADKAFVCQLPNVRITRTKKQQVKFNMRHVGARVRTKVSAFVAPDNIVATLGYQANKVPESVAYHFGETTYRTSTAHHREAKMQAQSYDIKAANERDAALELLFTTHTGSQYLTVLPGTKPESLVYQITGGKMYYKSVAMPQAQALKSLVEFKANGSYTLKIKLLPRYEYLFEDGKTGFLKSADRKGHTAIGLVFAPHRAISLWNAKEGADLRWDTQSDYYKNQRNSTVFKKEEDALKDSNNGKHWTWESYMGNVKVDIPTLEAYKEAVDFHTQASFKNKLEGKTLTGEDINKREAWYLPAVSEWKEVFEILGYGDNHPLQNFPGSSWKGVMVYYAFKVAKGESIAIDSKQKYWSSTERDKAYAFLVVLDRVHMYVDFATKDRGICKVRPFIAF